MLLNYGYVLLFLCFNFLPFSDMKEPVFEYIEQPVYIKPQVHYPHKEPFNL